MISLLATSCRLAARTLRYRAVILVLLVCCAYGLSGKVVFAHGSFGGAGSEPVPNYATSQCATCHTNAPTLNTFGSAFKANGEQWNGVLAALDSDGDNWTNGQELQDTAGSWKTSDVDKTPGNAAATSNPGVLASLPPKPTVTDITNITNPQVVMGNVANIGANVAQTFAGDATLVKFELIRKSDNFVAYTFSDNTAPYCFVAACGTWNSGSVADGQYTLRATVFDKSSMASGGPRTDQRNEEITVQNGAAPAANIRYVAPSGADTGNNCKNSATPCATLQRAAEQAVNGDELRVAAGTYTNTVSPVVDLLSKALTLTGGFTPANWETPNATANQTIIDGQNARRGITTGFDTNPVTIQGFVFRNGGSGQVGTAININRNNGVIRNNRFENNQCDSDGGALYVGGNGNTISDNSFSGNRAGTTGFGRGGAVFVTNQASNTLLERNRFTSNSAATEAGAIYVESGSSGTIISNGLFVDSVAPAGSDIATLNTSSVSLRYSTLAHSNDVSEAIRLGNATGAVTLTNVLISGADVGINITSAATTLTLQGVLMANDGANNVATAIINGAGATVVGAPIRDIAGYVGGGDYHLRFGAPAVDAGVALVDVTGDLDGNPRPLGGASDIGAYEFLGPSGTLALGAASASVGESAGSVSFNVILSVASVKPVTVNYATSNGTASAADYTATSGSLTFAPGESSKQVSVPILNDSQSEESETIIATLSAAVGAAIGSPDSATITIADDDVLPPMNKLYLPLVLR